MAFCTAFLSPAIATPVSTPLASICAKRLTELDKSSPISFNAAPLVVSTDSNVSIDMPVFWPAFVISPRTFEVWLVSTPNFFIIESTESIAVFKSVPFICANFKNSAEMSSSFSPVNPNLVLTSPTAVPASSADTATLPYTFFIEPCSPFNASPVAPVFVVTISSPASTSLNAAIEATPIAAIGAVTFFVSDVPALVALSPTPFIASPAAVRDLLKDALHSFAISSNFFNSFSVSIISRCKASYCCWLISPFLSAVLACSAAVFNVSSFSFVLPISSASNLCF